MTDPAICPICNGEEFSMLGILGKLAHLRCRACGADISIAAEQLSEEEEE
tara:strand:+ start:122 stop:271 length:150 start_codon:yes stop_codon:yes gene_type:complete